MSNDTVDPADNERQILERISYLETALENYGTQIRALNDVVSQIQVSVNSFSGQVNGASGQINELKNSVYQLTKNKNSSLHKVNGELSKFDQLVDYASYREQIKSNYGPIFAPIAEYEKLVSKIGSLKHLNPTPLSKLLPVNDGNKANISLRHDIDADPERAVELAGILAQYGIPGSFYVLHSAKYYGVFGDGKFHRNPRLKTWVQELMLSGMEVGVHNDAFGLNKQGKDGVKLFADEVEYLRSLGANITGSVAHNSFPTHFAENFEVFSEFVLFARESELKLGELSMKDLGLMYEGNYPVKRASISEGKLDDFISLDYAKNKLQWLKTYLHQNPVMEKKYEIDIWLYENDHWLVSDRRQGHNSFSTLKETNALIEYLSDIEGNCSIVVTVHPELYQR